MFLSKIYHAGEVLSIAAHHQAVSRRRISGHAKNTRRVVICNFGRTLRTNTNSEYAEVLRQNDYISIDYLINGWTWIFKGKGTKIYVDYMEFINGLFIIILFLIWEEREVFSVKSSAQTEPYKKSVICSCTPKTSHWYFFNRKCTAC